MIHFLASLSAQNKKIVRYINEQYTQDQLGVLAEKMWVHCSYPQPQNGSFQMEAIKIVGDQILLEGVFTESVTFLMEKTSCLIPLNQLQVCN